MAHSVENWQLYLGEKYLITTVCFLHRVPQNQMIRDTYTPEAIQALKRIKYVCLTVLNSAFINIYWTSQSRNNFQLSGQNNLGLHCFCSSLRCDWPRKLAPLSHLIRFWEAKTNRDLVTRVFPRSRKRAWFNSKYRSILIGFLWYLSLVWLAGLIISVGFLRL